MTTANETNGARVKAENLQKQNGNSDVTLHAGKIGSDTTEKKKFDPKTHKTNDANAFYMSYPIARSPSEETGDTLLIRCIEYIPPANSDPSASIEIKNFIGVENEANLDVNGYIKPGAKVDVLTGDNIPTFPEGNAKEGQRKPITIETDFKSANQRMLENSKILYYIELPIPQEVNDANQVVWGEDTLNALELAGLSVAQKFMQGNIGEGAVQSAQAATQALQRGIDFTGSGLGPDVNAAIRASISGAAINALGSNVSQKSILSRSTGQILNSNLELLFQGMTLRSFPFSVTFTPRNSDEMLVVKSIIRNLKKSMAPKAGGPDGFNGSSATGIFLKSPDLFSLQYRHGGGDHPFLHAFKICALTGMSVNYTNAGTYASYADGTPVAIRVNLTFKEINPIYAEDYEENEGNLAGMGVGY
tara:strand:+ start:396 stop:1649 length:1254 start_codon:yes stop_codon:yes gene_type:complete